MSFPRGLEGWGGGRLPTEAWERVGGNQPPGRGEGGNGSDSFANEGASPIHNKLVTVLDHTWWGQCSVHGVAASPILTWNT